MCFGSGALEMMALAWVAPIGVKAVAAGGLTAVYGTKGMVYLSQACAEKEGLYPSNEWGNTAWKIGKWAALVFSGITGVVGATLAAAGTGLALLLPLAFVASPPGAVAVAGIGAFAVGGFFMHLAFKETGRQLDKYLSITHLYT